MKDPVVIDRSTLNALLSVVGKEANRATKLSELARDPDVAAIHLEAAQQLQNLQSLTLQECHNLVVTEDVQLEPTMKGVDFPPDFTDMDPDGLS